MNLRTANLPPDEQIGSRNPMSVLTLCSVSITQFVYSMTTTDDPIAEHIICGHVEINAKSPR